MCKIPMHLIYIILMFKNKISILFYNNKSQYNYRKYIKCQNTNTLIYLCTIWMNWDFSPLCLKMTLTKICMSSCLVCLCASFLCLMFWKPPLAYSCHAPLLYHGYIFDFTTIFTEAWKVIFSIFLVTECH